MKKLTKAQYDILICIKDYIDTHGFSPTYREIAELTQRASISTIYNHIRLLIKKGYITMQSASPRTIQIIVSFNETNIMFKP